jgi:hypothetical protein
LDHGPGFRGHFFYAPAAAGFTNVCDKSARTAIKRNNAFASWHIAYKNGFQRFGIKKARVGGTVFA